MILPLTPQSALLTEAVTPLHRVDPRLKLAACGLLAILAFAAGSWQRLAIVAGAVFLLAGLARCGPLWMLRTLWPLRWLLLFTVLLHLLLSPGHTLFGVAWLSRDGLFRGGLVCGQLGIAVLAAALLSSTTSAERSALACSWLLIPLRRFGWPTRQWEEMMLVVLRFFPMLREELQAIAVADRGGWFLRVAAWEERLLPVFDRLVARADLLAHRLVAGEEHLVPERPLAPFRLIAAVDLVVFTAAVLAVIGFVLSGG